MSLPRVMALGALLSLLPSLAYGQTRVALALELDPCVAVDTAVTRRLVDVELRSAAPPVGATPAVHARVTCEGPLVRLRVDDALTGKSLERTVSLARVEPVARSRTLALAVVELVAASWAELELTPAPTVAPEPAPFVAADAQQSHAREVLRARAAPLAPLASLASPSLRPAPPRATAPPPLSALDGSIGLLHAGTAEMPPRAALRAGVLGTYASDAQLRPGASPDERRATRAALDASVAWSPLRHLEVFSALRVVTVAPGVAASGSAPASAVYVDALRLGVAGAFAPVPALSLGATAVLLARAGPSGFVADATGALLRAQGTLDLSRFTAWLPLRVHGNLAYRVDNSEASVAAFEQARRASHADYDPSACALPPTSDPASPRNAGRTGVACNQQLTRDERFALGIDRVDALEVAIAVDLWIASVPYLRPFVEFHTAVPVQRRGYVCYAGSLGPGDDDACLASVDLRANPVPSQLTLGVRGTLPFAANLSALVAVDIATGGTAAFVRELAPTTPFTLSFGLGIAPLLGAASPSPSPSPSSPMARRTTL